MKRKYLLVISFFIVIFAILSLKNVVLAGAYNGVGGIAQFVGENPGESGLGSTFTISKGDMYASQNLYCIRHDKEISRTPATFQLTNYIRINQNDIEGYNLAGHHGTAKTVDTHAGAALALAISGIYGPTRYRVDGVGDYTPTQKMMWPAFYYFLDSKDDDTGQTMRALLGVPANIGSISMAGDSETYRLQLYNDLMNGAKAAASIYILQCVYGNGGLGASQWQQLIVAIPEEVDETSKVTINKVDQKSQVQLPRVSFIIKSNATNQFIQSLAEDGSIVWGDDESTAYKYTTGISTYAPIEIRGLDAGFYTIKEVENLNVGYNTSANIGKEQVFELNLNGSIDVKIENSPSTGDDDDDDDKTSVKIKKEWKDNNNANNTRPSSIEVVLLADNQEVNKATLNEANNWEYTFVNLPIDKNGIKIKYSIKEINTPSGYYSFVSEDGKTFTITNTNSTETKITVKKEWKDNDNANKIRPAAIKFALLADGVEKEKISLSSANNWQHVFEHLPIQKDGKKIEYSVKEIDPPTGYQVNVNKSESSENNDVTFTITNTEGRTIAVQKVWKDNNNRDGSRPQSVKIALLADGKETKTVELNNANNWQYTFTSLPISNMEGKKVEYTVQEVEPKEGYAIQINSSEQNGIVTFTVENTKKTSITVKKQWEDNNNESGCRPEMVEFALLANGEEIDTIILNEQNNWEYTIKDLDITKDGINIQYDIEEVDVSDEYTCKINKKQENGNYIFTAVNTFNGEDDGEGNVTISGIVWEDLFDGKSNTNDSIRNESSEKGIPGVTVYWKDKDGNVLATATTDGNGRYSMAHKLKVTTTVNGKTVYKTYTTNYDKSGNIKNDSVYKMLNTSYIEFEYNGLKYTTVAATKERDENNSSAIEVPETRKRLDDRFDEVNKQGVFNDEKLIYQLKYDYDKDNATSTLQQEIKDFAVRANTSLTGITSLMEDANMGANKRYYHEVTRRWHNCKHCSGRWIYKKKNQYYDIDEWNITNMNLGLVRREQPDAKIESDIDKVEVRKKDNAGGIQVYTYKYGVRNLSQRAVTDYSVSFGKKYAGSQYTYTRPVNPSDIAYVNDAGNNPEDLQVFVTYRIKVTNQSNTTPMIIRELVNYYDDDYDITQTHAGWEENSKYGDTYNTNGYKSVYTNQLDGQKIEPQTFKDLYIEYKVHSDAIAKLLDTSIDGVFLYNVTEIYRYATLYGANTQCAENKKASEVSKTDTQYAGVDIDSAPGNAVPGNKDTYEDDTDAAPDFKLIRNLTRYISGMVWEDTDNTADNQRLGDGVRAKDSNNRNENNGVEDVKVELLIVDGSGNHDRVAKMYTVDATGPVSKDAIVYTKSDGSYEFEGVVTDNYILRFTYGNNLAVLASPSKINGNMINARNYKSTVITQEPVLSTFKGTANDKWHLTVANDTSIAVDDITKRLETESTPLQYNNFDAPVSMVAYSNVFKIQVESTPEQEANVGVDGVEGGNFNNNTGVFDFGIIERPREDIVIDKTIANLKITLGNGQILTEGNPYKDKMNYVKALGDNKTITTRTDALKAQRKLLYLEMDSELIQGSRIDLLYKITATNNSEVDYEYDPANGGNTDYYYYGEINSPKIKPSVELVVDYMDAELACSLENENNKNWKQFQAEQLRDSGLISPEIYTKITAENYLIFVTDVFKNIASGESHSEYLLATKLLANQAQDYTYENHTEIIRLNGKIARNIDSTTSTGVQVQKTYKPGTYIPSLGRVNANKVTDNIDYRNKKIVYPDGSTKDRILTAQVEGIEGLHNQDDDMIIMVITPPTGATNITSYIITGGIALIVIAIGVFIIKKKVLE